MSTSSVSSSTASSGTAAAGGSLLAADANATQDRFLKLLVAQLKNQDPMNPMDNAQMTSQMAQINTVGGIQQLNQTMKSMTSQFLGMQILQSASMVGHGVLLDGNTLSVSDGKASGGFDLAGNADQVSVEVLSAGGMVLDTVKLGARTEGRHAFDVDAAKYAGMDGLRFRIKASSGATPVNASTLIRDTIVAVGNENGSLNLQLKGRATGVTQDAIRAIY